MGRSFPLLILRTCFVSYALTLLALHKTRGTSGRGRPRSCPTPGAGLSAPELGLAMGSRGSGYWGEVLGLFPEGLKL